MCSWFYSSLTCPLNTLPIICCKSWWTCWLLRSRTLSWSSWIFTVTLPLPVVSIIRDILIISSYTTISCSSSWLRSVISWMNFTLGIYWSRLLRSRTFSWSCSIFTITLPLPVVSIISNILIVTTYTTISCRSSRLRSMISWMSLTLSIDTCIQSHICKVSLLRRPVRPVTIRLICLERASITKHIF